MAYTAAQQMVEFRHALNQGTAECIKLPEAASQSATLAGDLVYLVSGAVTLGDASDPQAVFGFLREDCSGTTGATVNVLRVRRGDVFEANVVSDHTPGTDIYRGCKYGLDRTGAGNWEVDADGNATVIVLDYVTKVAGGRVLITFLPAVIQSEIGA